MRMPKMKPNERAALLAMSEQLNGMTIDLLSMRAVLEQVTAGFANLHPDPAGTLRTLGADARVAAVRSIPGILPRDQHPEIRAALSEGIDALMAGAAAAAAALRDRSPPTGRA